MKIFLEWTIAILLSLALAVVIAELVLRSSAIQVNNEFYSVIFLEHPEFFRDQQNRFGYKPFSQNRVVGVYSDHENAWVEYDAPLTANNAGLVQQRNIDPSRRYTVIVGDSFTQGLGTRPWFYDLERDLSAYPLANLGVMATGVAHWVQAVDWFQDSVANVDKVVIIFVADDFFRAHWLAKGTEDSVVFCYEERCAKAFAKLHDRHPNALIEEWYHSMLESYNDREQITEKVRAAVLKFRVGRLLINLRRSLISSRDRKTLELNKRSFEELIRAHNVAMALHLPEKAEAYSQKWSADSLEVRAFITKTGLPYIDGMEQCHLNSNDYHSFDSHPNASGYQKIRECVTELLNAQVVLHK